MKLIERVGFSVFIIMMFGLALYAQVPIDNTRTLVPATVTYNADKSRTVTWNSSVPASRYILIRYTNFPSNGLGGEDLPVNSQLLVIATFDKTVLTYKDTFQVPSTASTDVHYMVIADTQ